MVGLKKKLILWWEKITNFNPHGIWPSGHCPVQAEGYTKDGKWYYFRARGNQARFMILESKDEYIKVEGLILFERVLDYGGRPYQAGWLSHEDAVRLTTVWLNEYYNESTFKNVSGDEPNDNIQITSVPEKQISDL